jgi:hypothetical protein
MVPYQALKTMTTNDKQPRKGSKVELPVRREIAPIPFQTEFQKREARLIAWRNSDAGKLAVSNYICRNCGKKGHMGKECRSQRKVQVLATTAVDDEVTMAEYAAYFDGEDGINNEYEFEYSADIGNDVRDEVWQAFVVKAVDYDSDGMPALDSDSDDSEDESELQNLTMPIRNRPLLPASNTMKIGHHAPAMYVVALSTQQQMQGSLSLDTQSSVNITPDAGLLSDIRDCKPILVGGINKDGEPLKIAQLGLMDGIKMYYNPAAVCSILSQSNLLKTGAKLAFLPARNQYIYF